MSPGKPPPRFTARPIPVGPYEAMSLVQFLRRLTARARSVCLLKSKAGPSTAFLVGSRLMLTCNHSFVGPRARRKARKVDLDGAFVLFDYDEEPRAMALRVDVDETGPLVSNLGLDFTLFSLKQDAMDREVIDVYPPRIRVGDDVFVISHPGGGPKQLAYADTTVTHLTKRRIRYRADTLVGSSGAPVFNAEMNLVAIHHRGDTKDLSYNEGVPMGVIHTLIDNLLVTEFKRGSSMLD